MQSWSPTPSSSATQPSSTPSLAPTPGACYITEVAGAGPAYCAGDGGRGPGAGLSSPAALVFLPSGDLLIADSGCYAIRIVFASNGSIATYAGQCGLAGTSGNLGNGGPRTAAYLQAPTGVAVLPDGTVLVSCCARARGGRLRPICRAPLPRRTLLPH